MNWKTKQVLIVLFGGLSIFAFAFSFTAQEYLLRVINLGIFLVSFIIAMFIKTFVPIKQKRRKLK
jgi:hypothetical protein